MKIGKKLNYKNEWISNTKTEFGYNSGNLIVRTDFHWNDTVNEWVPDVKKEYIYNTTPANPVPVKQHRFLRSPRPKTDRDSNSLISKICALPVAISAQARPKFWNTGHYLSHTVSLTRLGISSLGLLATR